MCEFSQVMGLRRRHVLQYRLGLRVLSRSNFGDALDREARLVRTSGAALVKIIAEIRKVSGTKRREFSGV